MHDSQAKSDVWHEMRQKTTPYAPLQMPACKENRVLLSELLYYVSKAMAVYGSCCSGIRSLCPDPGAHSRGIDGYILLMREKASERQFRNFFCKVMDVFVHTKLEKEWATMGAKQTLYYLPSVYSPVDFMLTDLSCYWKGLNNVKEMYRRN